jgi:5-methylcytosine-specific restriction endonuclease McrA
MKPHTINYFKHFDLTEGDRVYCEVCGRVAVDIHHIIPKSQGGGDNVENLIALSREIHEEAHSEKVSKGMLVMTHEAKLKALGKDYDWEWFRKFRRNPKYYI